MSKFSISLSVEIEADSYEVACVIRDQLFSDIRDHPSVISGPYEIDIEQTDGWFDEDEPC